VAIIDFAWRDFNAQRVCVFDAATMKLLNTLPLPPQLTGDKVMISPDGSKASGKGSF